MQKFYAVIDTNVIISRLIKSVNQDDLVFYYITLEAKESIDKDTYLITGNEKHFDLDFIVRPKEMLNIIENSSKEDYEETKEENENQE